MTTTPDLIEKHISNSHQAWDLLNSGLPHFKKLYDIWHEWYVNISQNKTKQKLVTEIFVIAYARMALRNGSLSDKKRCYHSETHIDDLIYRLIAISELSSSKSLPNHSWALLSVFMACHDLQQSEKNNPNQLIGNNEQASYEEAIRLIKQLDAKNVFSQAHQELLKYMIQGSTFGKGEDTFGNVYKGNMVKYIFNNLEKFNPHDKEIAYLACDIDTANVGASLKDYAQSSINVFNEIQRFSMAKISAKDFFGIQQEVYFFELQKFNSSAGVMAFYDQKIENAPKIEAICEAIKKSDNALSNDDVVGLYLSLVKKYS